MSTENQKKIEAILAAKQKLIELVVSVFGGEDPDLRLVISYLETIAEKAVYRAATKDFG